MSKNEYLCQSGMLPFVLTNKQQVSCRVGNSPLEVENLMIMLVGSAHPTVIPDFWLLVVSDWLLVITDNQQPIANNRSPTN
ncbi:hypothetical protein [Limnofasciculus baicalensis]|uniref:Uncharacterized protein n=1 Tax=Limnofasciculus baicalensis BBK-W-15 TaxID=2699891 RepID=A0AAE3GV84_9CYAN|nr:hypothetical protein [Limnofasciculus baicalensis]MCP2731330.1 hypothetical protein [Limnofasciculus baicalensis BBK-W-15]